MEKKARIGIQRNKHYNLHRSEIRHKPFLALGKVKLQGEHCNEN
jgi:hypothetical protein